MAADITQDRLAATRSPVAETLTRENVASRTEVIEILATAIFALRIRGHTGHSSTRRMHLDTDTKIQI